MMKNILTIILAFGTVAFASGQSFENALLFANQNYSGTARSSAMGGAFSSLGGDISVAHTNPAGLAIFRHGTFAITPALYSNSVSGDGKSGDKTKFILPSLGAMLYSYSGDSGVKNLNFGLTYTQGANYNSNENFEDLNSAYSLLGEDIVNEANNDANGNFDPYEEKYLRDYYKYGDVGLLAGMAYNTKLLQKVGKEGAYLPPLYLNDLTNRFSKTTTKGSNGEIAFSVAGNYEDKLYFGATLGIQNVEYKNYYNYEEQIANKNSESKLDYFTYNKFLQTRGAGTNLKLGLIYRPIPLLRVGIAVHTPTYYTLEDEYQHTMKSKFVAEPQKGAGLEFSETFPRNGDMGIFEYYYRTPWKFTFGGSYIFPKIGLISVDYELTDYSTSKYYSENNDDFSGINQQIKDTYKMAGTLKIGAEVRLNKQFALRGGYNHFGSPYNKKNSGVEQTSSLYSAGLGYRYKNVFVDASYQYYTQKLTVGDYKRNFDANTVKLTLGIKF